MPIHIKPVRRTNSFHHLLNQFGEMRFKQQHYRSFSDLLNAFLLFDMMTNREHAITARIMQEPDYIRDQVIEEVWEGFCEGKQRSYTWLDARLDELNGKKNRDNEAR